MTHELDRRTFLKTAAAASLGAIAPQAMAQTAKPAAKDGKLIWANLLHLSYNMWCDWDAPSRKGRHGVYRPDLRFDMKLWQELLERMARGGMNMVVIDLGDGVKYKSHPEISVRGAWTPDQLREQLARCRKLGLEPIPKLNFSTCHDSWLGPYARKVSTPEYYDVCRELISETIELFDKPRFFHLGMDEEAYIHQKDFEYVVVRQFGLWWHDFNFYCDHVRKGGSRPWIWSDYIWEQPDDFLKNMAKDVVQSNWYYGTKFDDSEKPVKAYRQLDQAGFNQIPTGSNWTSPDNFGMTADYCMKTVDPRRLLGFIQTPWQPTLEVCRKRHEEAIDQVAAAIARQ